MSRKTPPKVPHIEMPFSGTRWYHEDYLLEAFEVCGFTKRSFRDFMKALGVPKIYLPKGVFYDGMSISIAMKAVGRIGRRDFAAPGSPQKDNGYVKRAKLTTSLDPMYVKSKIPELLAEMWAAKPEAFDERPKLEKATRRVADALVSYAVLNQLSRDEQQREADKHIRTAVNQAPDPGPFQGDPE